jgi:hypothetical protein
MISLVSLCDLRRSIQSPKQRLPALQNSYLERRRRIIVFWLKHRPNRSIFQCCKKLNFRLIGDIAR